MGIFDDAIREHLELKRHAGADDEELKELEDEAFGPPARPGEPDFPGSTSEESAIEDAAVATPGISPEPFDAEGTLTEEAEIPSDAVVEAPPAEEQPALSPLDGAVGADVEEPPAEPATPEPESVEPEHSEEPPAETSGSESMDAGSAFSTEEREAIADQPTVFFEQQAPADLELGDLDLDLDEEIEEVGSAVSEPLIVEEAFAGEPAAETEITEPPHEVEPEPEPTPPAESEPEPAAEPEPAPPSNATEPATSEDDVLEETPEFLRDNPDDDELWFEQGEPKDFDF